MAYQQPARFNTSGNNTGGAWQRFALSANSAGAGASWQSGEISSSCSSAENGSAGMALAAARSAGWRAGAWQHRIAQSASGSAGSIARQPLSAAALSQQQSLA
jgi:hypothetical protein